MTCNENEKNSKHTVNLHMTSLSS